MEYWEYLLDDVIRGDMYSHGAVYYLSIKRFPRGLSSRTLTQSIEPIPMAILQSLDNGLHKPIGYQTQFRLH